MMWFSGSRKRIDASIQPADTGQAGVDDQRFFSGDTVTNSDPASGETPKMTTEIVDRPEPEKASALSSAATGGSAHGPEPDDAAPAADQVPQVPDAIPAAAIGSKIPVPEYKSVGRHRCGGVALALGGGVARGWAHIGVLRAVEEFGLPVSMVAGTSIGALVGGSYLAGRLDQLEEFARSLTKTNIVRYLDFSLRGSGLITGSRLARRMDEQMADIFIENLDKPFVAVATEINSGHEVWLSDGPIGPAIRASYALPGIFTPVVHGGRQLVDGALVNPVPVSVCRAYEPDLVIAVNLNAETFGRGTVVRPSHYEAIEDAITHDKNSQAASWFSFMNAREKKATPRQNRLGVTSVMVESFNIIQDRIARARLAGDPPDFTVRPKMKTVGLIEFHKAAESIDLGYKEMMMRLNNLQEQGVLGRLDA